MGWAGLPKACVRRCQVTIRERRAHARRHVDAGQAVGPHDLPLVTGLRRHSCNRSPRKLGRCGTDSAEKLAAYQLPSGPITRMKSAVQVGLAARGGGDVVGRLVVAPGADALLHRAGTSPSIHRTARRRWAVHLASSARIAAAFSGSMPLVTPPITALTGWMNCPPARVIRSVPALAHLQRPLAMLNCCLVDSLLPRPCGRCCRRPAGRAW